MGRNNDVAKTPNWDEPMSLGRDCSNLRCRVKVEISIEERRMKLDREVKTLQSIAPKMRVFTQSLIRDIVGSKTKAFDLDQNMIGRTVGWYWRND
jgi:hypothetical protein